MNFEWIGHHKLLRIVRISGHIVNDEPLRVGAGREKALFEPIDLVVLKTKHPTTGEEIPLIPGSSLKGLFRATAVSVARSVGLDVCDGTPGSTCLKGDEFYKLEKTAPNEIEEKVSRIIEGKKEGLGVCLNCLIFGSPSIHSHVSFSDSFVEGDYSLGYRTCVAIDRRYGAAWKGALYTVEYVEPGARFNFELRAENLPNYALGLLASIIDLINLGVVRVGGMRSKGFGRVHFDGLSVSVYSPIPEYGVCKGRLNRLDPIDSHVMWRGSTGTISTAEGRDADEVLNGLKAAWNNSLEILRRISDEGWRWSVALECEKS
ncbi:MAG: CRISPR-associated RAMP protein [Thaumarchaeota archaeon]|nr:MAG: CRISPR-associated RAMP protein [Nitrososphaerota archaeon]